jgi:hypothetical protein
MEKVYVSREKAAIDRFIADHRGEEGFSFAFAEPLRWNVGIAIKKLQCSPGWKDCRIIDVKTTMFDVMYGEYFSSKPKYIIRYDAVSGRILIDGTGR